MTISYKYWCCSGLTSVTIPSSVTSIGNEAFEGTAWINNQPDGVVYVGNVAYRYKGIMPDNTIITLKEGTVGIADYAFSDCGGLTSVTIPNSVTSIGKEPFYGCSGLTSVTIGNGVTSIGEKAFYKCSGLTSVTIGNGVTSIGSYSFYGCSKLNSVTLPDNLIDIGKDAFDYNVKMYVNKGTLSQLVCWNKNRIPYQTGTEELLQKPYIDYSSTQTTSTIMWRNIYSEYTNEYCINDGVWLPLDGDTIQMTGLRPEISNNIQLRATKASGDTISYTTTATVYTQRINPSVQATCTASSITALGRYTVGDANVVSERITFIEDVEGNTLLKTGLDPNSQYQVSYSVVVQSDDGNLYSYMGTKVITTSPLTLTTSQPKVISAGNVIVAAESNLDDEETNVGFEWRRTDWTDDFASNTGNAYLYEGTMEGYIRNLYTGAFWKYRPYYLSNSGTYYYGDWVGIDPTNTSYFEPTVHTYARTNIEGNTALVRGYALRGTDNVTVQGFMYWRQVNGAKEREDTQHRAPAIPKDAMTVEASGQVMEAQLTGLDYGTTYCYVAFVKTSEGETFYGETQTFTTDVDVTGIEGIAADFSTAEPATVVARYNLNGQRITTPQRGVNILRMSDGTSRKVLVK